MSNNKEFISVGYELTFFAWAGDSVQGSAGNQTISYHFVQTRQALHSRTCKIVQILPCLRLVFYSCKGCTFDFLNFSKQNLLRHVMVGFFDVYSGFSDRKTPEFEISDLIGPRTSNNEDSDKNKQKLLSRSDLFNSIWDSIKNFPKVVISDQLENFCQGIMGQTIE